MTWDATALADRVADRFGDREAFVDVPSGERLTFMDMADRAARVAGFLRDHGVRRGDRVAVLAPNRIECVDLLLACDRLGAALVPLNIRLAADEVAYLLGDCDPRLVLASHDLQGLAQGADVPAIDLDGVDLYAGGPLEEAAEIDPEDPAFLIYTGGTTGLPKGAVIPWRAVLANADNTARGWGLCQDDVTPLLFPFFHTGGWNVVTLPFYLLGAKVVLMGPFDAGATLHVIEDEGCTLVVGVPTMFHAMLQHPDFDAARLATVRESISGGAPCPVPLMEAYWQHGLAFKMGYGLTEAGPNNFVIDPEVAKRKPTSVGHPVPGVTVRIAAPDGTEAPVGEAGELQIRGDHVFSGYWNRPDADAEAFTSDGWLRTGDVAVRDGDGDVFIVDRLKDMFISGGENVYPVEVEQVLARHPDVDLVAVIGVPDERWGEVGKAFVQVRRGHTLDPEDLLAHARRHLARYKVPKYVEAVDALPVSGAGKILKKELRRDPMQAGVRPA